LRRLLPALLLAGCLQGGTPELDGAWYATWSNTSCYRQVTFGAVGDYSSNRICPGSTESEVGTYAVDGDVIHVVTGEAYDMRWSFGSVPDALALERDGKTLFLHRRTP
jgi:hypothetical protein